jgi:hypothetical protein
MSNDPTPPETPTPPTPPPPSAQFPAIIPQQQAANPLPRSGPYYPNQDERTTGMLIHLLAILTGFIGPLVLWLIRKDNSQFVDFNGKEAINFQITILIILFSVTIGGGIISLLTLGVGLLILIPALFVIPILALIFEIMACLKAHRGEWARYPVNIRFLR